MRHQYLLLMSIVACIALLIGFAASADDDDTGLPEAAMPLSKILDVLHKRGFSPIIDVEIDDGVWEVEAYRRGRIRDFRVDPVSGEIQFDRRAARPKSAAEVAKLLESKGYKTITDMEIEDERWEVTAEKDGQTIVVAVDASLKMEVIEEEEEEDDDESESERNESEGESEASELILPGEVLEYDLPWQKTVVSPIQHIHAAAIKAFRDRDYILALRLADLAIESQPRNRALDEFRGLVLFAKSDYPQAAAAVRSTLDKSEGWNWETIYRMYASVDTYAQHLRALEEHYSRMQQDTDARLLLAYHYVACGHESAATDQLRALIALNADDAAAVKMLERLDEPGALLARLPDRVDHD